jgi:hypothetical protein
MQSSRCAGQRVLAIDPSLVATGVAELVPCGPTHELAFAQLAHVRASTDMLADRCARMVDAILDVAPGLPDTVVIERPRIHVATRGGKADPDDIIKLALLCGAIAQHFHAQGAGVVFCKPDSWKGQMPKDATTARTVSRLGDNEMRRVNLPPQVSLQHNVWDAVGIGLWSTGRM